MRKRAPGVFKIGAPVLLLRSHQATNHQGGNGDDGGKGASLPRDSDNNERMSGKGLIIHPDFSPTTPFSSLFIFSSSSSSPCPPRYLRKESTRIVVPHAVGSTPATCQCPQELTSHALARDLCSPTPSSPRSNPRRHRASQPT